MRLFIALCSLLFVSVAAAQDSETPEPPGFIVFHSTVTDFEALGVYAEAMMPVMTEYGGQFIVLANGSEALEGNPDTRRMAILAFPTMTAAREFWDSDAYQASKELRDGAGDFNAVLVAGLAVPLDSNTAR